jgi:hypothetical protein
MHRSDLTKNGVPQWIFSLVLLSLIGLFGWTLRSVAGDVDENSEHRIAAEATQGHIDEQLEEQGKKICRLENAVTAIHDEQQIDRSLLNRIADKVGAKEAPPVKPLPPTE